MLTLAGFDQLLADMVALLDARAGTIEFRFPFFVRKAAPVSGVNSLMDYQVALSGAIRDGKVSTILKIVAPVTSLCPCSKTISEYGAHNQRSHVTVSVETKAAIEPEEIIAIAEAQASSELYGLLKRVDETIVLTILGVVIVSYAVYGLLKLKLPRLDAAFWPYLVGFLSGVLGGASGRKGCQMVDRWLDHPNL